MSMSLRIMGSSSCNQQSNHGIMGDEQVADSSSSSEVSDVVSDLAEEEDEEEVASAASSSPSGPGPLSDLSTLLQQLPFKRGLSKHYEGKSQSFTCMSNVRCLEDLAKPEHPYNKRLKSCGSYAAGLSETTHNSSTFRSSAQQQIPRNNSCTTSSRLVSRKGSRGSCSSVMSTTTSVAAAARKSNGGTFIGNRPPIHPPHRSTSSGCFLNRTPLFA